jgi:hypothetical protein
MKFTKARIGSTGGRARGGGETKGSRGRTAHNRDGHDRIRHARGESTNELDGEEGVLLVEDLSSPPPVLGLCAELLELRSCQAEEEEDKENKEGGAGSVVAKIGCPRTTCS